MTRLAGFTLLAVAAFDWPLPWLDRAGVVLLGLSFLALALSPGGSLLARPARMTLPPKRVELPEPDGDEVGDLFERIAAYDLADELLDRAREAKP